MLTKRLGVVASLYLCLGLSGCNADRGRDEIQKVAPKTHYAPDRDRKADLFSDKQPPQKTDPSKKRNAPVKPQPLKNTKANWFGKEPQNNISLKKAPRRDLWAAGSMARDDEPRKKVAAQRRLELRLKALALQVHNMHEGWVKQRSASDVATSMQLEAQRLTQELDPIVQGYEARATVSVHVRDLDAQAILYEHRAQDLRNPASNQKMITASAALDLLGPEYVFETKVYSGTDSIYLSGEGDPDLTDERIKKIAYTIANEFDLSAFKRIIVDDTVFSPDRFQPGEKRDTIGYSYAAPSGALSMNANAISVIVSPTRPGNRVRAQLRPVNTHVTVQVAATTTAKPQGPLSIRSHEVGNRTVIKITGTLASGHKPVVQRRLIYDPARFAGEAFSSALAPQTHGKPLPVERGHVPPGAHLLGTWHSHPLFDIVQKAMAYSNNFAMEQILRTLAWRMTGTPGDWKSGSEVLEAYWATIGVNPSSLVATNGSGLSNAGRFTARGLVDLLSAAHLTQWPNSGLLAVLPVAGKPGTLHKRHLAAKGRLRAKTGTLNGVSALSGVLTTRGGVARLAFSIMINPGGSSRLSTRDRHRAEAKIVGILLRYMDRRNKYQSHRGR